MAGDVGGPALEAGDADMDCDFDKIDIVKVQVAAKYLTDEAATRGEGDWDGVPGGWTQTVVSEALPSPSRLARSSLYLHK